MATLELRGVVKEYENSTQRAVDDISLDVADGEFVVFVGPSGCGKSTALRMIAGLEDITDGELAIDGAVVNDVAPRERDIALVFQNYALYPHMSVAKNLAYPLKIAKVSKAEQTERVQQVAETLQLTELLDRKPGNLSGGQRQRVAMGRALIRRPTVFLMDEPLSNLDAKLRVAMRSEITKIQRHVNVTTIYVTHDQVEAMTMGDRVVVLNQGTIQQADKPEVLYNYPANTFVAGFIGSPAMNLFHAEYYGNPDGSGNLSFGPHTVPLSPTTVANFDLGQASRSVVAGIRPEHISDASNHADDPACIDVNVQIREALGSEVVCHFDAGVPRVNPADATEQNFVGRFAANSTVQPETRRRVRLDTDKFHFFDPATELRLTKTTATFEP